MAKYGLIKSFDIDDGQLDGIPAHQCFVMGYELALIDEALKLPAAFSKPVRIENRERILKSLCDSKRKYSMTFMQDDQSESWLWLSVMRADA